MYGAKPKHWFTEDGEKIENNKLFEAKTLSDLGYMEMHHYHRRELGDLSDKERKVTILYSPAIEVTKYGKHYGWYYFWNCSISRYEDTKQHFLSNHEEYRDKILNTPKYWAGREPK